MQKELLTTEEIFRHDMGTITKRTHSEGTPSWSAIINGQYVGNNEAFEAKGSWFLFKDGEIVDAKCPAEYENLHADILAVIDRLVVMGARADSVDIECEECNTDYYKTIIYTGGGLLQVGCQDMLDFFYRIGCVDNGRFVKIDRIPTSVYTFLDLHKREAVRYIKEIIDFLDNMDKNA